MYTFSLGATIKFQPIKFEWKNISMKNLERKKNLNPFIRSAESPVLETATALQNPYSGMGQEHVKRLQNVPGPHVTHQIKTILF